MTLAAFPTWQSSYLLLLEVQHEHVTLSHHPEIVTHLDSDTARALAAALLTAADQVDDVRPLRRRAGVDDELRERDA